MRQLRGLIKGVLCVCFASAIVKLPALPLCVENVRRANFFIIIMVIIMNQSQTCVMNCMQAHVCCMSI